MLGTSSLGAGPYKINTQYLLSAIIETSATRGRWLDTCHAPENREAALNRTGLSKSCVKLKIFLKLNGHEAHLSPFFSQV